jgi:DNA-binding NarL/FixJ family response regulator
MEGTMARHFEPKGLPLGYALPDTSARRNCDVTAFAASALVAALEEALHAAHRLLVALQPSGSICTEDLHTTCNWSCNAPTTLAGACASNDALTTCLVLADSAKLTRRETEVLGFLAAGRNNHSIARALCLSPRTVQRHVANVYIKIGAHNRAEATAYAMRHGIS